MQSPSLPSFVQKYFDRMGSGQLLTAKENYIGSKPQLLAGVEVSSGATGHFYDRNRHYYTRPLPTVQTDDYYDLAADRSAEQRWRTNRHSGQTLDEANAAGTFLDSRLSSLNKTPSRQSRLLADSHDNLTSSTDQKQSQGHSLVSYETHHKHERAGANAKNTNNYCKWSKQY